MQFAEWHTVDRIGIADHHLPLVSGEVARPELIEDERRRELGHSLFRATIKVEALPEGVTVPHLMRRHGAELGVGQPSENQNLGAQHDGSSEELCPPSAREPKGRTTLLEPAP